MLIYVLSYSSSCASLLVFWFASTRACVCVSVCLFNVSCMRVCVCMSSLVGVYCLDGLDGCVRVYMC